MFRWAVLFFLFFGFPSLSTGETETPSVYKYKFIARVARPSNNVIQPLKVGDEISGVFSYVADFDTENHTLTKDSSMTENRFRQKLPASAEIEIGTKKICPDFEYEDDKEGYYATFTNQAGNDLFSLRFNDTVTAQEAGLHHIHVWILLLDKSGREFEASTTLSPVIELDKFQIRSLNIQFWEKKHLWSNDEKIEATITSLIRLEE